MLNPSIPYSDANYNCLTYFIVYTDLYPLRLAPLARPRVSLLAECHTLPFGRVPYRQRQRRGRGKGDHFYSYLINNKNKKRAQGARDTFLHYLFSFVSFNLVSFFRQLD